MRQPEMRVDRVKSERERLASLCAECMGRCCMGHHIILSGDEYRRLKKRLSFREGVIDSPTGCRIKTIDALERCPFLGNEGCILEEEERPLVCGLYPLTPLIEKNKVAFYLSSLCPYVEEIKSLSRWITESTAAAEKELSSWDRKELAFLGKRKRRPGEELIPLDL